MKILVNKNQYKKLINEISLLDVIKQADQSDILSLEIPDVTNPLNLKLTRQAMENVLKRGVSELEKYIDSPEEYIKSLAIEVIPEPKQTPQLPEEPPTPPKEEESPQIKQKIKELEQSQEYLDELTSKKGYKSVRDRNNIDLLRINIARLQRDLDKLRNLSESKKLIKKILKETIPKEDVSPNDVKAIRVVLSQMKRIPVNRVEGYEELLRLEGSTHMSSILTREMESILKLVGGSGTLYWKDVYWWVKTFLINGGYGRDFKTGEIEIPEIKIYEMEADYTEEVFEHKTSWGEIAGASSEEEAMEWYQNSMHKWEEDSEHQDSDYGEITDIDNVQVSGVGMLGFNPQWIGSEYINRFSKGFGGAGVR
tara:strand:- start:9366 stop:10466 length:1101 start_codon:yes stop_codon:yes gene_type:complete